MPTHKRHEPFRYEFRIPHDTSFYISKVSGRESHSKSGKGVLINISPGGLRMKTSFDLPEKCELTFEFIIAEMTLQPVGEIVWKRSSGKEYLYGVDFTSEAEAKDILKALKLYAKK
ncbi:PilZ domain-containing protein [Alkalicoccus daliensis]|uniref:PilZ domain-containing protein n=1 Tax=Alkalicoccus daliensis TaxID=745820 RepID=A0A1H0K662_9BACI|nr:PilZ domain-containing protein [Alkalicoccus daliensis]SDO51240.1 PilZ domain-containing protein [Alkalicoccus daliensis]